MSFLQGFQNAVAPAQYVNNEFQRMNEQRRADALRNAQGDAYGAIDPQLGDIARSGGDPRGLMQAQDAQLQQMLKRTGNIAAMIARAPDENSRRMIYRSARSSLAPMEKYLGLPLPQDWSEDLLDEVQNISQVLSGGGQQSAMWSSAGNNTIYNNRTGEFKQGPQAGKTANLSHVLVPQSDGSSVLMNFNPVTGEYSMPNFGGEQPQPIGIDDPEIQADIASLPPDQQELMRRMLQAGEGGQEVNFRVDGGKMIPGRTDQATGRPIPGLGVRPARPPKSNERAAPAGYRWTASGGLEFIPGGPADPARKPSGAPGKGGGKAPTEDQAKAAGWYDQALNAFNNMEKARKKDANAEYPSGLESFNSIADYLVPDGLVNYTRSPTRQQYLQGSSALTEAVLRAATGAAITKEEALQKLRELTPQPGDSQHVVEQKRESLKVYLQALKRRGAPALGSQEAQMPTGDLSGLSDDELKRQLGL